MFRYFFKGQRLPTLTDRLSGGSNHPFSTIDGGHTVIGKKAPRKSNSPPAGFAVHRCGHLLPKGPWFFGQRIAAFRSVAALTKWLDYAGLPPIV